ncbi:MAG: hypothetical protein COB29_01270 [Sulfitobacter sp.]|nr:MAG: hypothetical protein COB29_01270 [Sulfitobacter sp.]
MLFVVRVIVLLKSAVENKLEMNHFTKRQCFIILCIDDSSIFLIFAVEKSQIFKFSNFHTVHLEKGNQLIVYVLFDAMFAQCLQLKSSQSKFRKCRQHTWRRANGTATHYSAYLFCTFLMTPEGTFMPIHV